MKLIFFGTGEFALPAFKKIAGSGHEIAVLVTQPDRKRGRGWNLQPPAVKALAEKAVPGLEILQPEKLDNAFIKKISGIDADVFVVVDYGKVLPKGILSLPKKYCINLHPSLLPRYRGSSPINRAILNGDEVTGNTVIEMSEQMDAGPILMQEEMKIKAGEDAPGLFARLSSNGAELLVKTLGLIEKGKGEKVEQDENKASYAPKLKKEDGEIDWSSSAACIERQVRALKPWPGAYTYFKGKRLKIIKAGIGISADEVKAPGTFSNENGFSIYASDGPVRVVTLQLEGKKAMSADEFIKGNNIAEGTVFGAD